ncbi:MAG TPA: 4-alpha-glucanotransferase [Myxococcota bacterium]|nr:4-alpha-glucanotransferase [Myxococcota bacterium]HQK50706.1 4-alpha-glucanotransferase [Myxococcota bacterium]
MGRLPEELRRTDAALHWERIGARPRRGVCVPLSALRSERDCGIGDLADLPALGRWCRAIGAEVVQLLPVNDLGTGSCPYSALSAFALDPVYVALDRIPGLEEDREWQARVQAAREALPEGPRVDWDRVREVKEAVLAEAARWIDGPLLQGILRTFQVENPWLREYLPYRVQKDLHGQASWEEWGARDREALVREARASDRWFLHLFAQWLLDLQFREAREALRGQGVLLEGDIPILVGRDSADVWAHPELFHLDVSAGAPPDMYSQEGQNWGFPTYRWDRMEAEDDRWWRARLRQAERYYDLYRIDHVVGFFRIWTIPAGERTGRIGRFVPEDESLWGSHGSRILRMMLSATGMLPLAEDLGTIPDVCRETLLRMGICGFKVQRWEKRWNGDRRFIPPADYPLLSMATLSTHDSEILAQWWQENPTERQELHGLVVGDGEAPGRLTPDLHRRIQGWLARGRSLFLVLLMQEILWPEGLLPGDPADHRVNLPGTIGPWNWTWRCPVGLEDLLGDPARNARIRQAWTPDDARPDAL